MTETGQLDLMTQLSKHHRAALNAMGIDIWRQRGRNAGLPAVFSVEADDLPSPPHVIEPQASELLAEPSALVPHATRPEVGRETLSPNLRWSVRDYRTLLVVIVNEASAEGEALEAFADDVARAYNGVELTPTRFSVPLDAETDQFQSLAEALRRSSSRVALLLGGESLKQDQLADLELFLRTHAEPQAHTQDGARAEQRVWIRCGFSSESPQQLLMKRRLWLELSRAGR